MRNRESGELIGYVVEALVERPHHPVWIRLFFGETREEADRFLNTELPTDALRGCVLPYFRVAWRPDGERRSREAGSIGARAPAATLGDRRATGDPAVERHLCA